MLLCLQDVWGLPGLDWAQLGVLLQATVSGAALFLLSPFFPFEISRLANICSALVDGRSSRNQVERNEQGLLRLRLGTDTQLPFPFYCWPKQVTRLSSKSRCKEVFSSLCWPRQENILTGTGKSLEPIIKLFISFYGLAKF